MKYRIVRKKNEIRVQWKGWFFWNTLHQQSMFGYGLHTFPCNFITIKKAEDWIQRRKKYDALPGHEVIKEL